MDKNTLSSYGWIVVLVLVLSVLLALASPFGHFIANGIKSTTAGFFSVQQKAIGSVGLVSIPNQSFDDGGGSGSGDNNEVTGDAYAIYDSNTQGLYFVRSATKPEKGSTFTASNGKTLNVTDVYSDFENKTDYYVYDSWNDDELNILPEWREHKDDIVYVEAIDTIKPKNMAGWFLFFSQCNEIYLDKFDTSEVTSLQMTFQGVGYEITHTKTFEVTVCETYIHKYIDGTWDMGSDTYTTTSDGVIMGLKNWDTSKVTNMDCTFANIANSYYNSCYICIDDISGWDVSSCMSYSGTFASTCMFAKANDLTNWNIRDDAYMISFRYSGPNMWIKNDLPQEN